MQFLIQGDRGVWVEYLQLALTRAGHPTRIDGIFGERTCQALKDFTGNTDVCTVNREVWEKLNPYLTGYRMHTIEKEIRFWTIAQIWDNGGGNPYGKSAD